MFCFLLCLIYLGSIECGSISSCLAFHGKSENVPPNNEEFVDPQDLILGMPGQTKSIPVYPSTPHPLVVNHPVIQKCKGAKIGRIKCCYITTHLVYPIHDMFATAQIAPIAATLVKYEAGCGDSADCSLDNSDPKRQTNDQGVTSLVLSYGVNCTKSNCNNFERYNAHGTPPFSLSGDKKVTSCVKWAGQQTFTRAGVKAARKYELEGMGSFHRKYQSCYSSHLQPACCYMKVKSKPRSILFKRNKIILNWEFGCGYDESTCTISENAWQEDDPKANFKVDMNAKCDESNCNIPEAFTIQPDGLMNETPLVRFTQHLIDTSGNTNLNQD